MAEVGKSPLSLNMFEGKTDTCVDKWNVKAEIKEHDKKQSFWIGELRRRAALEKGISTFWMAVCSNWSCGCSCAELEMRVRGAMLSVASYPFSLVNFSHRAL